MANLDPTLAKLTSIEDLLREVLTGRRNTSSSSSNSESGQTEANGPEGLTGELIKAITQNTRHLGNLIVSMGGRRTGVSSDGALNAVTPSAGGIGASSFRLDYDPSSEDPKQHLRYGNIPRAISAAVNKGIEKNPRFGIAAGVLNNLTGAVPSVRNEYNNLNAQMQAGVDRRITNPTQLGMLSGLQGPGSQNVFSAAGSYFSSMFAAPSLVLSGGMNPNKIGSFFGQSMSPATSQGWQSQYRAFTRSLNPFDMLSNTQALGINQAVAKKGFANMGQQINIEQAVTDIVQSVGIDAGAAIDTMDLAVKRLHMSVSNASDLLKDFGQLAIGAGKGVSQFAQEANAVTASISVQGGIGSGAQMAGAAYSSFNQVSGQAAYQLLNSPKLSGLTAARIMSGGGKFATPANAMLMAMGNFEAMAGGNDSLGVFEEKINTVRGLVDTFKKGGIENEDVAIQMAASQLDREYLEIKQIYQEGPRIVKQQKVLSGAMELKKASQEWIGSGKRRGQNAEKGEGLAAFKEFQRQSGKTRKDWSWENNGSYINQKGIDWDHFSIGDSKSGPDFNEKVRAYYNAKMNNDSEGVREALANLDIQARGRVTRAGNLLFDSGLGKTGAIENWRKLQTNGFGVKMDYMGKTWDSTGLTEAEKKEHIGEYLGMATPLLSDAQKAGIITPNQEKSWLKKIQAGDKSLTPEKLYDQLTNKAAQQSIKEQGGVQISIEPAMKKYFRLTDTKNGNRSIDGTLAVEVPNGTNNRNMAPAIPPGASLLSGVSP